jgi:hypothetical protein
VTAAADAASFSSSSENLGTCDNIRNMRRGENRRIAAAAAAAAAANLLPADVIQATRITFPIYEIGAVFFCYEKRGYKVACKTT